MNKDKKSIWIAIFIFILYGSASGNYLNSGDDYLYNNSSWLALIDLLIASVVMMIVPFIWRLVNKELLPFKKGKRICLWNSIILFIVSVVLTAAADISIIGGIGALIYYYINKWLFVDYMNLGVSTNHQAESTTKFKCSLCGAICNEDDKYCKNCQAVFEDEDETEEESET